MLVPEAGSGVARPMIVIRGAGLLRRRGSGGGSRFGVNERDGLGRYEMLSIMRRGGVLALVFAAVLWTSGCVVQDSPEKIAQIEETNDPFEPTNRYFFELNRFMDEFMLKPISAWYQAALPQPAQDGVQKFLSNLRLPWTAVNDFFQGNMPRAYSALARFTINTTVGVVGIFDVATGWGYPQHDEDLGQTLAVMGAPEGPYLMLPLFGPSNPRDAIGLAGDFYLDPVNVLVTNKSRSIRFPPQNRDRYTWFPTTRSFVEGVDTRARNGQVLSDLEKQSIDFYATIRSVYRQHRDAQINNRGEDASTYPSPRLSLEPGGRNPYQIPEPQSTIASPPAAK